VPLQNLYFWAAATLLASGFLLSARNWPLFLVVLVPGAVALSGLWVDYWSILNCHHTCPSGYDKAIGPISFLALAATLLFLMIAAVKAVFVVRRSRR
jgi:hypothetical protein